MHGLLYPDLGTRKHCCDNAAMFSGQKTVDYIVCSIIYVHTLWLLHLDTARPSHSSYCVMSQKLHYVVALSLVVVAKQKNWSRAQLCLYLRAYC